MTQKAAGLTETDPSSATALRDRWREATITDVWLRPGDWFHPAVDALTEALSHGTTPLPAARRLGEVRGQTGVGIGEGIDDLAALYRLLDTTPDVDLLREFCEGWALAVDSAPTQIGCIDPESGLPTADYLAVRLGETYSQANRHAHHAFVTHALLIVDIANGELPPWRRMARSAAMGHALTAAMGPGYPMAALGGGAFAVLVARDLDLGETVRRMRDEVEDHAAALDVGDLLRTPPRVWIEPLPETHARSVDLLSHLRR